jgi:hypothetical protein
METQRELNKMDPPVTRRSRSMSERVLRASDGFFDKIGLRPLGIVIFSMSAVAFVQLLGMTVGSVRSEAVATSQIVEHPSPVGSFATDIFVKPGDVVEVGSPLIELSSRFIERELARLEGRIEELQDESLLAEATLHVNEERWLDPGLRQRPNRPSLEAPTKAFFSKQLELLEARRRALFEEREGLLVRSSFRGVVAEVTRLGAWVPVGASVASVMPEFAEEIVAYMPPGTNPSLVAQESVAYIVGTPYKECLVPGRVKRRGATVSEAPGQLKGLFLNAVHGMPVHVAIPDGCKLGNGQVVTLDFRLEVQS